MTAQTDNTQAQERPAERMRESMAAVRLSFTWFGTRKTLSTDQKAQAADTFGAEGKSISAGKKLIDTSHPAFRAVTAVRTRAVSLWRGMSLPYPEPGIRLIRQDDIERFNDQMTVIAGELAAAVDELDRQYWELRDNARARLGSLFNPADYPDTLRGLFNVEFDFPSVEPPDYLRQLNPALYAQETARVAARFDEAVQLAEQAFIDELAKLVSHLTERLSGSDDGKPKVFRDSAIANLAEYFQRFSTLNVRSNAELDQLVARAQEIVGGIEPRELRTSAGLRQHVATQMSAVGATLDGMLIDRPRRKILRRATNDAPSND